MQILKRLALALALTTVPLACGPGQDASTASLKAGPPNLRFSGIAVIMLLPNGAQVGVLNGDTFHVPCETNGFRAKYRYQNNGESAAGAHKNVSGINGGTQYPFTQAPLNASTIRYAYASFGKIPVANVETKLTIKLDGPGIGAVAEANEGDNQFVAKVVRDCP